MTERLANTRAPENGTVENPTNGSHPYRATIVPHRNVDRLRLLWTRRRTLLKWTLAGAGLALFISIFIPNRYQSTARLMPPDQSNAGMAMLAAATGGGAAGGSGGGSSSNLGMLAGDLLGLKSSSALFVEILQGRTVQDDVINKFNLRKVYSDRYMEDARLDLKMNTDFQEDRRSGIITIQVEDKDPRRAAAMAGEFVSELDRLVNSVNTSSAHRERVFLDSRLEQVKVDLASAEKGFSEFSSKNSAIDVPVQGKAMIEAASALEGEYIATQTELESLKQIYADGNVRVRAMQARANEIQRQLSKLSGKPGGQFTPSNAPEDQSIYPSIRALPLLAVNYADLFRNAKIQEAIFETLTKQRELAKVQEAKEIPSVKVIDSPIVPEKKSFPHRMQIGFAGAFAGVLSAIFWLLAQASWEKKDPHDPQKMLTLEVYHSVKGFLILKPRNGNGTNGADGLVTGPAHETKESLGKQA
jgi:uncharacterized protein involved in exopolysaccharide biosynthesis